MPYPRPTTCCPALLLAVFAATASGQFASEVVEHAPGTGAGPGYADPTSTLGPPARMSGLPGITDSVVTPFQPAYMGYQLLTVGRGGHLVVRFEEPVLDEPGNPHGIDPLVFGNAFFTNTGGPLACTGALYDEGGRIELSADGVVFVEVPGVSADGLFPTLGYVDAAPFDTTSGTIETDFTRPVDPAWAPLVLEGSLCWEDLVGLYEGSGGGTPIDLAWVGLAEVTHVRISVPEDAGSLPEIDAFADVAPARPVGDLDGDGRVGGADLALLLAAWGELDHPADLDRDGVVGGGDLTLLLGGWDA